MVQLKRAAEAEQRSVDDVLAEALNRYMEERSRAELVAYGRKQGESVGITSEEGIDRAHCRMAPGEFRAPRVKCPPRHSIPDKRILECAVEAKSDFIVTEDKDILRLGRYENSQIVTIRDSSVWRRVLKTDY